MNTRNWTSLSTILYDSGLPPCRRHRSCSGTTLKNLQNTHSLLGAGTCEVLLHELEFVVVSSAKGARIEHLQLPLNNKLFRAHGQLSERIIG